MRTTCNLRWLLLILLSQIACRNVEEKQAADRTEETESALREVFLTPEQIRNAGITWNAPVRSEIALEIPVSGMLDVPPQNLHSIGTRVNGMVKSTSLLQGAHVHKGEILCVIENPEFLNWQQEYLAGIAKLENLETDLQRQTELADKNLTSRKNLQQIQTEVKMLKASQNALKQRLKINGFSLTDIEKGNFSPQLNITAPDDGFITSVFINTGQVLKEGDPICELVNPEHIHAELMVFEKDVAFVKEGQDVEFELAANPGTRHPAKVFLVNRKISKDRTVQVHAHLEKMEPEFLPGMQISAHIRTRGKLEWTIPSETIVYEGKQAFVFASGNQQGFFRKLPVQVLVSEEGKTAVSFPGIPNPESLRLVTSGAYDVKAVLEKSRSGDE